MEWTADRVTARGCGWAALLALAAACTPENGLDAAGGPVAPTGETPTGAPPGTATDPGTGTDPGTETDPEPTDTATTDTGSTGSSTGDTGGGDTTDPELHPSGKLLVDFPMGSDTVPVWVDRPLDQPDPGIRRAILVVHGSSRDPEHYFDVIRDAVPAEWEGRVAIVAPYFQEQADAGAGELWWDSDWKEGGDSGGVSSFDVADELVRTLRSGVFPNLEYVVVTGHSAGGQFSQRYAAFTDVDEGPEPSAELMKFVPANPSSYLYLGGWRWDGADWTVPPVDDCAGDTPPNEYKYGLDGLYGYAAVRGESFARAHLPTRWMEVLAGTADVTPEHGFDDSCAAMWEGPNRWERAHLYVDYMDWFYAPSRLSVTDVPGVDHDGAAMLGSAEGVAAMYFP